MLDRVLGQRITSPHQLFLPCEELSARAKLLRDSMPCKESSCFQGDAWHGLVVWDCGLAKELHQT